MQIANQNTSEYNNGNIKTYNNISKITLSLISDMLLNISHFENDIELSRQVLNDNNDYDPLLLFRAIDVSNKNSLRVNDILQFLHKYNIPVNQTEVERLITFYDETNKNELSYFDFTNIVQSSTKRFDFTSNTNQSSSNEKVILPFNIEYLFLQILEKELILIRYLLQSTQDIKSRYDFDIHVLYNYIKTYTTITFDSLNNFFKSQMKQYISKDIRNIIKRMDINRDGKIDLKEFNIFFGIKNSLNQFNTSYYLNSLKQSNEHDKQKLLDYIRFILSNELQLEKYKCSIALLSDFNIENIFRLFDKRNTGTINHHDIKATLFNMAIYASDIEINALMHAYDVHMKGYLGFGDLFDMLAPYDKDLRCLVESRKPIEGNMQVSTSLQLIALLKYIIEYEGKLNILRSGYCTLVKKLPEIYAEIDKENKGYISYEDFEMYLKENKISECDIGKYLCFIKFDRKRKGVIDYCALRDQLSGINLNK